MKKLKIGVMGFLIAVVVFVSGAMMIALEFDYIDDNPDITEPMNILPFRLGRN